MVWAQMFMLISGERAMDAGGSQAKHGGGVEGVHFSAYTQFVLQLARTWMYFNLFGRHLDPS